MTKVIVDAQLKSRLKGLSHLIELCDESGQTLGFFHPLSPPRNTPCDADGSPYTREELEEFRKDKSGRPLEDILHDLEQS